MQYILCGGQLYRSSYDGIHPRFVKKEEAKRVIEEVHQGICGPHMNGRMLAKKILRMGYYWNTMETDCIDFVKRKVINFVPFQPEWPENTIPACKPEWHTPLFHLRTNSGSFRSVWIRQYWLKLWIQPE